MNETLDALDKARAKEMLTHDEFEGERMYREGIMLLNFLLDECIINDAEYEQFNELLKEEYNPIIGGLI